MRYRLSVFVTTFLFALAITAMQAPQPKPRQIPPYPGDDNPMHDGQPNFCVNHDRSGYEHNCACYKAPANRSHCDENLPGDHDSDTGPMSTKCSTRCRKPACRCVDPCTT